MSIVEWFSVKTCFSNSVSCKYVHMLMFGDHFWKNRLFEFCWICRWAFLDDFQSRVVCCTVFREYRCICLCFGSDSGKSDFLNILLNLSVGIFIRFSLKMRFLNRCCENSCICLCFGINFGKSDFSFIFTKFVGAHFLTIFRKKRVFQTFFVKISAYAYVSGSILENRTFQIFCWICQ